jgi:hypothetical protein
MSDAKVLLVYELLVLLTMIAAFTGMLVTTRRLLRKYGPSRVENKGEPDSVLLIIHDNADGGHRLVDAEWYCGKFFAAPFSGDTRCLLLPGGAVTGPSYVKGWLPASGSTQAYFNATPEGLAKLHADAKRFIEEEAT